MTSQARAVLDGLFGPNRNRIKSNRPNVSSDSWQDSSHCSAWLLDICPHDLLVNTRVDLGRCARRHDHTARLRFTQDTGYPEYFDAMHRIAKNCELFLRAQVARCGRRAARQAERLSRGREATKQEISDLLKKAEILAETGEVAAAMALMKKAQGISDHEKKEAVCETCGAIVDKKNPDMQLTGRQHRAYTIMMKWLEAPVVNREEDSMLSSISD